jgi:hypothetical protein
LQAGTRATWSGGFVPAAEFCVFGVVTETAFDSRSMALLERGNRLGVVRDAIETCDPMPGIEP